MQCCASGHREDSTRVGQDGAVCRRAVDVSSLPRMNQDTWRLSTGARRAAFVKTQYLEAPREQIYKCCQEQFS